MYYVISHYHNCIQHLYVILNKVILWSQTFHLKGGDSIVIVLVNLFPNISFLLTYWQSTLTRVINKMVIVSTWQFCFICAQINVPEPISKIYKLSTIRNEIWALHLKRYVAACFQIKTLIILSVFFGYILGFYFSPSSICQFYTYSRDRKVLESTVHWLPIKLNQLQPE